MQTHANTPVVVVGVVPQVVRELQVPQDWPPSDDNDLALLVNETVQVWLIRWQQAFVGSLVDPSCAVLS